MVIVNPARLVCMDHTKMILLFVFVMCLCGCFHTKSAEKTPHTQILFVGNSLTYYNDLPTMVKAVYAAALDLDGNANVTVDMLAKGGISIEQHLNKKVLQDSVKSTTYDYVVLQDFGGWPNCGSHIPACSDSSVPLAKAVKLVRESGAKPIWFSTYRIYENDQNRLSAEAAKIAKKLNVDIADVGAALHKASSLRGLSDLLTEDFHPNEKGSWVAAITITRAMINEPIPKSIQIQPLCRNMWQESNLKADQLASQQKANSQQCGSFLYKSILNAL